MTNSRCDDEGGTNAVALLAGFNVDGDSWRLGDMARSHNLLLGGADVTISPP